MATITTSVQIVNEVSASVPLTASNTLTTALLHEATTTITNIDTGFWHTIINFIHSLI